MKKLVFICVLICSCAPKERIQKPQNLMSHQQMVDFLVDVNFINASRGYRTADGASYINIKDSVLYARHQIDSLQFAKSNAYYASKPKEYFKIYEFVEEKIVKIKDSLDTLLDEDKTEESI